MTSKTIQFGKIPTFLCSSGILAHIDSTLLRVYMSIACRANGKTWKAWPSVALIAQEIGMSERTVQRATRSLQSQGLIEITAGPGWCTNTYTIVTDPDAVHVKSTATEDTKNNSLSHAHREGDNSASHGCQQPNKRVTLARRKGDTQSDTLTEEQSEHINRNGTTAAEISPGAALEALHAHEISAPTDKALVRQFPGMTPSLIADALADAGTAAGPGCRVDLIRSNMPRLIKREAEQVEHIQGLQIQLREIVTRATDHYLKNHAEIDQTLDELLDHEISDLRDHVRHELIMHLGGDGDAHTVVDEWLCTGTTTVDKQSSHCMIVHARTRREERRRIEQQGRDEAIQRSNLRNRQKTAEKEKHEQERQLALLAERQFDALDDCETLELFRSVVQESKNKKFREKYLGASPPDPDYVRKHHRHDLILYLREHGCRDSELNGTAAHEEETGATSATPILVATEPTGALCCVTSSMEEGLQP